jgi:hypothetical protein
MFPSKLAKQSISRFNEIGIQMLSKPIHEQLFASVPKTPPKLVELSKKYCTLMEGI